MLAIHLISRKVAFNVGVPTERDAAGRSPVYRQVLRGSWGSRVTAWDHGQEAGVAVLSGTDFGEYGEGYLRLSYTNSLENIHKGLDRMKDALAALR